MTIRLTLLFLCIGFALPGRVGAAQLRVLDVETVYQRYPEAQRGLNLTVTWDHSWHNGKNHDAAWVFLKSRRERGNYGHIALKPGSLRLLWKGQADMPGPAFEMTADQTGFFIYAAEPYRGPLTYRIYVEYDLDKMPENAEVARGNVQGYGIEMVYIPEGGYGYRGGGHYGEPWISNANPYSPIAHRPYAAWSAGPRREAYGTRAARTAPQ